MEASDYKSEAYHVGYAAYRFGIPRDANPYREGSWDRGQWFDGWSAAYSQANSK